MLDSEAAKLQMEILNKVVDVNQAVLKLLEYLNVTCHDGRSAVDEIEQMIRRTDAIGVEKRRT